MPNGRSESGHGISTSRVGRPTPTGFYSWLPENPKTGRAHPRRRLRIGRRMLRSLSECVLLIVSSLSMGPALAQVSPTFEVASARVNKSGELAMPSGTKGQTYRATNIPLRYLIASAFRMPATRVLGGPVWVGDASVDMCFRGGDRFDISARLPHGTTAAPELKPEE